MINLIHDLELFLLHSKIRSVTFRTTVLLSFSFVFLRKKKTKKIKKQNVLDLN